MSKIEANSANLDENLDSPLWLTKALRESRDYLLFKDNEQESVDIQFRDRCREATSVALSLSQLRGEKERIGFVPLSLGTYIQGLVRVANVSLPPILQWLGVEELSQIGPSSAVGLARLACGVGMELREALIHLRIGFAEQVDGAPMTLLVARHRSTGGSRSNLEECESVLGEIESEYDVASVKELRRAEFEFRSAYKERASL